MLNALLAPVAVLLFAAFCQWILSAIDARRYPPPGRLVEVGGHRLHVCVEGCASPVVVFEAGAGGFIFDWEPVRHQVAEFAQAVTYDRAGYGWSDPGPLPRDAQRCVHELHALLSAAGIPAPYVLVGHSVGGLHVQLYASLYPEEVAAVVLVDATEPLPLAEQLQYLPPEERTKGKRIFEKYLRTTPPGMIYQITRTLVPPLGLFRMMGTWLARSMPPYESLPADMRPVYRAIIARTSFFRTLIDEGAMIERSKDQVRQAPWRLNDKPLIVVKSSVEGGRRYDQPHFAQIQFLHQMRQAMQIELARRSTQGKFVLAERSAHYVHIDRPDIVVQAIRDALGA